MIIERIGFQLCMSAIVEQLVRIRNSDRLLTPLFSGCTVPVTSRCVLNLGPKIFGGTSQT